MSNLPAGWEQKVAADGRTYFVDHTSKATHWALPAHIVAAMASSAPPAALASAPGLPPGWEQKVDPTGRSYYVNHTTATTQWEPPTGASVGAPAALSQDVMDVFAPRAVAPAALQPSMSADEAFARRLQEEMEQGGGGSSAAPAPAPVSAAVSDAEMARRLAEQFAAEDTAGGTAAAGGDDGGGGGGDPPNNTLLNVKLSLVRWAHGIVVSYDASSETHTLYCGDKECVEVKLGGRKGRPFEKIEESRARFECFVELLSALEKVEPGNKDGITTRLIAGLGTVLTAHSGVLSATEADAKGLLEKLEPFGGTLSLFTMLVKALALRSAAAAAAEALVALASLVMAVPALRAEVFTHIIACDGVSALLTALSAGPSDARPNALKMLALLIEDSDIRATFLTTGGVATLARLDSYLEPMQLQAIGMLSKLIRSEDGKGDVEVMRQARAAGVFSAIPALLRASNGAIVNAALEVLAIGTTTLLDRGEARAADAATVVDQSLVRNLVEFGFDRELAAIALARSGSDVNAAYELLATGAVVPGGGGGGGAGGAGGAALGDNTVDKQRLYRCVLILLSLRKCFVFFISLFSFSRLGQHRIARRSARRRRLARRAARAGREHDAAARRRRSPRACAARQAGGARQVRISRRDTQHRRYVFAPRGRPRGDAANPDDPDSRRAEQPGRAA